LYGVGHKTEITVMQNNFKFERVQKTELWFEVWLPRPSKNEMEFCWVKFEINDDQLLLLFYEIIILCLRRRAFSVRNRIKGTPLQQYCK
jgi:hypothetical protein